MLHLPLAPRSTLLCLGLLGCTPDGTDSAAVDTAALSCEARFQGSPPTSAEDISALVELARAAYFPTLAGVALELTEIRSEDTFFQANLDLATLDEAPLERTYRVQYNPLVFDDPPPRDAVGAILVHELRHVLDYTELTSEELVDFALWYGAGGEEVYAYERATDEYALEAGCGPSLSRYREWLYVHIPPEDVAAKRASYYTPEEIAAWIAANE